MKELKIISDKYKNFDNYIEKERHNYLEAKPYPHIVINDFFDDSFLNEILTSFPDLSQVKSSEQWKNQNEVKFGKFINVIYESFIL